MKRNVGLIDSYIRLAFGFFLLGLGVARAVRRPARIWPRLLVLAGAIKIAEGITRFCPLWFVMGVDTRGLRLLVKKGEGRREACAPSATPPTWNSPEKGAGDSPHEDVF